MPAYLGGSDHSSDSSGIGVNVDDYYKWKDAETKKDRSVARRAGQRAPSPTKEEVKSLKQRRRDQFTSFGN